MWLFSYFFDFFAILRENEKQKMFIFIFCVFLRMILKLPKNAKKQRNKKRKITHLYIIIVNISNRFYWLFSLSKKMTIFASKPNQTNKKSIVNAFNLFICLFGSGEKQQQQRSNLQHYTMSNNAITTGSIQHQPNKTKNQKQTTPKTSPFLNFCLLPLIIYHSKHKNSKIVNFSALFLIFKCFYQSIFFRFKPFLCLFYLFHLLF